MRPSLPHLKTFASISPDQFHLYFCVQTALILSVVTIQGLGHHNYCCFLSFLVANKVTFENNFLFLMVTLQATVENAWKLFMFSCCIVFKFNISR